MIVVALDTCFDACSVAVADLVADRLTLLASERQLMSTGHAEAIVPMLDRVMAASGRRPTTIAHVLVTHGPGTFAGTRIGVAVARALRTATQATTSSLSSLEAIGGAVLARPDHGPDHPVAVAIDARRGQLYFQIVSRANGPVSRAMLVTAEEAASQLPPAPVAVVGNGGAALVAAARRADVAVLADADPLPDARSMVATLTRLPGSSARLTPLYLREADTTRQTASVTTGDRPR
jgi:tRNA threonylcarbamoyladenosine biosynthesis protein TsaB